MENNTPEILPCPFCGGEGELKFHTGSICSVVCELCGSSGVIKAKPDEAKWCWNQRAHSGKG